RSMAAGGQDLPGGDPPHLRQAHPPSLFPDRPGKAAGTACPLRRVQPPLRPRNQVRVPLRRQPRSHPVFHAPPRQVVKGALDVHVHPMVTILNLDLDLNLNHSLHTFLSESACVNPIHINSEIEIKIKIEIKSWQSDISTSR